MSTFCHRFRVFPPWQKGMNPTVEREHMDLSLVLYLEIYHRPTFLKSKLERTQENLHGLLDIEQLKVSTIGLKKYYHIRLIQDLFVSWGMPVHGCFQMYKGHLNYLRLKSINPDR